MKDRKDFDKWVQETDRKILHVLWTILLSVATSVIVTLVAIGR